jgi:alpha-mannosidase
MRNNRDDVEAGSSLSRRNFVLGATSALAGACALPHNILSLPAAEETAGRPVLHIIGHSHIDAAWLWPWTDSADVVLTTFRSALDRMQETPRFRYSHSSTAHYQWVQKADPEMFEEIRGRIKEGRWEVVGGWPVEPDCNIPSTESFARHCLYGKIFCEKELGVDVNIGFNPDSFGHAAGLPTILKHAGYEYYVFMRPQEHEMTLPRLFWWEGPDGSRVMAYRIYGSYDLLADHIRDSAAHAFPDGSQHGAFFLGVGDHGGAVTKAQLKQILEMQSDQTLPELRFSTVGEFFDAVKHSMPLKDFPVVRGDLQHHSRGCYSACGEEKFQNRRAERQLFSTESVALVASISQKRPYPGLVLAGAWERVLFNQFHDVLAGTSLYSDYQYARDGIGYACQLALESSNTDLEALAKQVDLHDVPEGAIFAYNPFPWHRKCLLEFRYRTNETDEHFTYLKSRDAARYLLQMRPSDSMTNFYPRLSAWVDLPPCGYRVFTIERDSPPPASAYSHAVSIAKDGFGIKSLRTDDGTELLAANLGLVVIEDKSDTWAHNIDSFRKELGRPVFVSSEVIENGPVTRVTRQKMKWQDSEIILDIAEFTATDIIELRFTINWQEHEQILKLELPTKFTSPKVFAKVPGAALERTANGNEEPYQDWIALQGNLNGQDYTFALANAATYSYDCLDGLLRTILVRSAPYARHNPNKVEIGGINAWQDQGRQERAFWLLRGKGTFDELFLDRRSRELQTPAEYVMDSRHSGTQPWEQSFLEITPNSIEVLALKQAEQGDAAILRLQERSGKRTSARIRCPHLGVDTEVSFSPWELKTLSISEERSTSTEVKPVSLLEE